MEIKEIRREKLTVFLFPPRFSALTCNQDLQNDHSIINMKQEQVQEISTHYQKTDRKTSRYRHIPLVTMSEGLILSFNFNEILHEEILK